MPDSPVLLDDTIAALASAPGAAARGIVRVTGPDVRHALTALVEPAIPVNATRARRYRVGLRVSELPCPIPAAVHFWPGQRSYTGQPMVEFHMAGSPPLLEAALAAIHSLGIRPAQRGEFTLRAFLAGRIDLVQAEAVLGVIDASDHVQLEQALRQLAGGISGKIAAVRMDLLDLLADLEAGLDFVDEDIEFIPSSELIERVDAAQSTLEQLRKQTTKRMRANTRRRVVLAGLPNAGKSTLFNCLLQRQAALVSEVQGTTRDYLIASLDVGGLSLELVDTAGWESLSDGIAEQAQLLREEQIDRADLILWCTATDTRTSDVDAGLVDHLRQAGRAVLHVLTKHDLSHAAVPAEERSLSAVTGHGVDGLVRAIASRLSGGADGRSELLGTTASRCRDALDGASRALAQAARAARLEAGDELIAIEVRDALDSLGRILGTVYTDDVLDRIFSKFCIGK